MSLKSCLEQNGLLKLKSFTLLLRQQSVVEIVSKKCEVEQEEGLLTYIEIISSSEYESESEASTGFSPLPLYTSLSPILPSQLLSSINSSPYYNTIIQHDINQLLLQMRQQQEQIAVLQTLLVGRMSQTSFSLYLHNQWTDFH